MLRYTRSLLANNNVESVTHQKSLSLANLNSALGSTTTVVHVVPTSSVYAMVKALGFSSPTRIRPDGMTQSERLAYPDGGLPIAANVAPASTDRKSVFGELRMTNTSSGFVQLHPASLVLFESEEMMVHDAPSFVVRYVCARPPRRMAMEEVGTAGTALEIQHGHDGICDVD